MVLVVAELLFTLLPETQTAVACFLCGVASYVVFKNVGRNVAFRANSPKGLSPKVADPVEKYTCSTDDRGELVHPTEHLSKQSKRSQRSRRHKKKPPKGSSASIAELGALTPNAEEDCVDEESPVDKPRLEVEECLHEELPESSGSGFDETMEVLWKDAKEHFQEEEEQAAEWNEWMAQQRGALCVHATSESGEQEEEQEQEHLLGLLDEVEAGLQVWMDGPISPNEYQTLSGHGHDRQEVLQKYKSSSRVRRRGRRNPTKPQLEQQEGEQDEQEHEEEDWQAPCAMDGMYESVCPEDMPVDETTFETCEDEGKAINFSTSNADTGAPKDLVGASSEQVSDEKQGEARRPRTKSLDATEHEGFNGLGFEAVDAEQAVVLARQARRNWFEETAQEKEEEAPWLARQRSIAPRRTVVPFAAERPGTATLEDDAKLCIAATPEAEVKPCPAVTPDVEANPRSTTSAEGAEQQTAVGPGEETKQHGNAIASLDEATPCTEATSPKGSKPGSSSSSSSSSSRPDNNLCDDEAKGRCHKMSPAPAPEKPKRIWATSKQDKSDMGTWERAGPKDAWDLSFDDLSLQVTACAEEPQVHNDQPQLYLDEHIAMLPEQMAACIGQVQMYPEQMEACIGQVQLYPEQMAACMSQAQMFPEQMGACVDQVQMYTEQMAACMYPEQMEACMNQAQMYPEQMAAWTGQAPMYAEQMDACMDQAQMYPEQMAACMVQAQMYPEQLDACMDQAQMYPEQQVPQCSYEYVPVLVQVDPCAEDLNPMYFGSMMPAMESYSMV